MYRKYRKFLIHVYLRFPHYFSIFIFLFFLLFSRHLWWAGAPLPAVRTPHGLQGFCTKEQAKHEELSLLLFCCSGVRSAGIDWMLQVSVDQGVHGSSTNVQLLWLLPEDHLNDSTSEYAFHQTIELNIQTQTGLRYSADTVLWFWLVQWSWIHLILL